MPSTVGRLNLKTAARRLAEESADSERESPPAPMWRVPTGAADSAVHRKTAVADPLGGSPIPEETATLLRQTRGSGAPLPASVARTAGSALGADLGSVRVHTDARADDLARSMQAVAFSYGSDMYFSSGTYRPNSPSGSELLAHELSHVAEGPGGGSGPVIGRADDPSEARADRAAATLAPALRRSTAEPQSGDAAPRTGAGEGAVIPGDIKRAVLRRKITSISKTSTDVDTANGGAAVKKGRSLLRTVSGSKNSLFKIGKLLDLLQKAPDDQAALFYLGGLVVMCEHWLDRHEAADNPKLMQLIEDIYAEARRDRGKALAQQRYMEDLTAGETARQAPKAGFRRAGKTKPTPMTQQIGKNLAGRAEGFMDTAAKGSTIGAQKRVADLINDGGMTAAEVAAVIAYTASDYLYINPATANSDSWLAGQQNEIATAAQSKGHATDHLDQKQMKNQGVTHAGMLMQAMAKMPVMKGVVYRGARMNQKEFDETYRRRTQIVYSAFTSTSVSLHTCKQYASGASERPPRADQDISVKAYLTVTDARDVKEFSDATSEKEWLLKPGATFKITRIEDDPEQDPGVVTTATQWKIVHLQQVPNGRRAPMLPSTPSPQIAKPGAPAPSSASATASATAAAPSTVAAPAAPSS